MAICGLNVSLDSLQGDITAKISGFISLDDALEAPELLSDYKATLLSGMASMKANVSTMIPDIPISSSGFTSLRDQLAAYVSVPSVGGLADITSKFGGLTSMTGMANINLADMAKSALSLSASFDPCSLAGDLKIPNIVANAAGELEALADQAPDLGGTVMALTRQIEDSKVLDSIALAAKDNVKILTSTSVDTAKELFETNIVPSLDEAIKRFPNGKEVVNTVDDMVEELAAQQFPLEDEDDCVWNVKRGYCQPEGETKETLRKLYEKEATQGERLRKYKQSGDNPNFDNPEHPDYHLVNGQRIEQEYNEFTGNTSWSYINLNSYDDVLPHDWD